MALRFLLVLWLGLGASAWAQPTHPALQALPARLAWAWERPEDLRWLPADAGVAYVFTRIKLQGTATHVRPRAQPLQVRPGTALVPVVHVDASTRQPPLLTPAQRDAIVAQLLRAAQQAPQQVVQLDFEARLSQRSFLAEVVTQARRALPPEVALSMTALASWCAGDAWLKGVPADEIVPMAFRMSRGTAEGRALLARQGRFTRPGCSQALGTATDEPLHGLQVARQYVFSPRPWTAQAWAAHP